VTIPVTPEPRVPPPGERPWGPEPTPYEALGGAERVQQLAEAFYDRVEATAPTLRAMLPKDTSVSRRKLTEFLSGWLGGPQLYWEKYGHPRLRMRHFPFAIGDAEAEAWLRCMDEAMAEVGMSEGLAAFLAVRFRESALHLRNQ